MRTKTKKITDKAGKLNRFTVFMCVLTVGCVRFVFYHLPSLHFTSSVFVPTSLFSSFYLARYWFHFQDCNHVSVLSGDTLLSPRPLTPHPIHRGGAASFVSYSLAGYGDADGVWSRQLPFRWCWGTVVNSNTPSSPLFPTPTLSHIPP